MSTFSVFVWISYVFMFHRKFILRFLCLQYLEYLSLWNTFLPFQNWHLGPTKQKYAFGACADSEGPDQTMPMRGLIRAFSVCFKRIIWRCPFRIIVYHLFLTGIASSKHNWFMKTTYKCENWNQCFELSCNVEKQTSLRSKRSLFVFHSIDFSS